MKQKVKLTKKAAADAVNSPQVRGWLRNMRGGRSVSLDFFRRNGWALAILLIVILSLMGLRYKTKTRMVQIKRLNKELKEAESEKLREKQEYMTLIRQTRMNELVRENHLGLIHQEQPPYELETDAKADATNIAEK